MPQISVLMCTYREPAAYVAEAIASIRNQTWRDFEFVIIADDPENRAVIDLLDRQAAADSRIRYWINDRNRGLPASLNIGLSHCAGSYIARMDADDISLPLGRLRIRTKGSAGGHNGLKSIISHLGSDGFPRVKIGVGAPADRGPDQIDWVLSVPRNQDWEDFSAACDRASKAAEDYILLGADKAMASYN